MSAGGWTRAQRLAGTHDQDLSPLSPTANMDDFTTRSYGTGTLDNRPLFGETSARVSEKELALDSRRSGKEEGGKCEVCV